MGKLNFGVEATGTTLPDTADSSLFWTFVLVAALSAAAFAAVWFITTALIAATPL